MDNTVDMQIEQAEYAQKLTLQIRYELYVLR